MAVPALAFAVLVVGGVLVVRALWDRVGGGDVDRSRALSLLEERYARGEIDRDEFETRRQHLVDTRS